MRIGVRDCRSDELRKREEPRLDACGDGPAPRRKGDDRPPGAALDVDRDADPRMNPGRKEPRSRRTGRIREVLEPRRPLRLADGLHDAGPRVEPGADPEGVPVTPD